jgi:hypothetical protein
MIRRAPLVLATALLASACADTPAQPDAEQAVATASDALFKKSKDPTSRLRATLSCSKVPMDAVWFATVEFATVGEPLLTFVPCGAEAIINLEDLVEGPPPTQVAELVFSLASVDLPHCEDPVFTNLALPLKFKCTANDVGEKAKGKLFATLEVQYDQ